MDIPDVEIEPDAEYTVSVSTGTSPNRNYPNIAADLTAEGSNGQSLSYPVNAGVFTETPEARPTQSFNGGNYLRDIIFLPAGATVDLPDVDLRGNNNSIADGDITPDPTDGTDFGESAIGGAGIERTFAIRNAGTAPLNLGATPRVAIAGPEAGDFTIVTQPDSPLAPGAESTFRVRFVPSAAGVRNATISIENDSDENPYDFAIRGQGGGGAASLRILEIRPDLPAGAITLRWEGDGPQFQVEKATVVTGPFEPLGAPLTQKEFTDDAALTGGSPGFYRIRRVTGP
jgi:hypothetical protein